MCVHPCEVRDAWVHLRASEVFVGVRACVRVCVCKGSEVRGQPISTLQEARTTTDPDRRRNIPQFSKNDVPMMEHIKFLSWGHRSLSFNPIIELLLLILAKEENYPSSHTRFTLPASVSQQPYKQPLNHLVETTEKHPFLSYFSFSFSII